MSRRIPNLDPPPRLRRGRRALTPEERNLWARVAQTAQPLAGKDVPIPDPEPAQPAVNQPPPGLPVVEPAPARPRLLPLAGVERRVMRDLVRGKSLPDARLDLHGMRQAEAHQALLHFLYRQHAAGARLLLIITGKGGGEDALGGERGVLRRLVPHWLADPSVRRIVVGFEVSARHHGGEGALYVRIRRRQGA